MTDSTVTHWERFRSDFGALRKDVDELKACHPEIEGIARLIKRIDRDEQGLHRIVSSMTASTSSHERLLHAALGIGNNLRGFRAELAVARTAPRVVAVGKRFFPLSQSSTTSTASSVSGEVDVVACAGALWIEAKAQTSLDPNFLSQARLRLSLAEDNPVRYRPPRISYHFSEPVTDDVYASLQALGVHVSIGADAYDPTGLPSDVLDPPPLTTALLDVSTLCALVSQVTHAAGDPGTHAWAKRGNLHHLRCHEEELASPLLPRLEGEILKDVRERLVLSSIAEHFEGNLLAMFGGERERARWAELKRTMKIVDPVSVSARRNGTGTGGLSGEVNVVEEARERKALLVTANSRLGNERGVEVALHRAVWLTGN